MQFDFSFTKSTQRPLDRGFDRRQLFAIARQLEQYLASRVPLALQICSSLSLRSLRRLDEDRLAAEEIHVRAADLPRKSALTGKRSIVPHLRSRPLARFA